MSTDFDPRAPTGARRSWLTEAGAVCRRGVTRGKALLGRFTRTGIRTRSDFLDFASESIALDTQQRAELAAVSPAVEDRAGVSALLALYRRELRADRSGVAALRAHWSNVRAQRLLDDDVRYALGLKSGTLELGSRPCARYFDPATYRR
jgi:hypothetical protein